MGKERHLWNYIFRHCAGLHQTLDTAETWVESGVTMIYRVSKKKVQRFNLDFKFLECFCDTLYNETLVQQSHRQRSPPNNKLSLLYTIIFHTPASSESIHEVSTVLSPSSSSSVEAIFVCSDAVEHIVSHFLPANQMLVAGGGVAGGSECHRPEHWRLTRVTLAQLHLLIIMMHFSCNKCWKFIQFKSLWVVKSHFIICKHFFFL